MKKFICVLTACLSLLALAACGGAGASSSASAAPASGAADTVTFTDSLGNEVTAPRQPKTVAALLGSYADVWQLAGGAVAGTVSDAWDEGIALPATTVNLGSLKQPDTEALLALEPDLVLLSNDIDGHLALADTLKNAGIPAAYFHVDSFGEYLAMLEVCVNLTGDTDAYDANGAQLVAQVDLAKASVAEKTGPKVLLLRAYSSGVKAKDSDNFVGEMLRDLGAENIADSDGSLLENLQMEAIVAADPDVILVTTMGDEGKALENMKNTLEADPAWQGLTAVQNGRCVVLEKELFHYKPNAKWGEAYEKLADILYRA